MIWKRLIIQLTAGAAALSGPIHSVRGQDCECGRRSFGLSDPFSSNPVPSTELKTAPAPPARPLGVPSHLEDLITRSDVHNGVIDPFSGQPLKVSPRWDSAVKTSLQRNENSSRDRVAVTDPGINSSGNTSNRSSIGTAPEETRSGTSAIAPAIGRNGAEIGKTKSETKTSGKGGTGSAGGPAIGPTGGATGGGAGGEGVTGSGGGSGGSSGSSRSWTPGQGGGARGFGGGGSGSETTRSGTSTSTPPGNTPPRDNPPVNDPPKDNPPKNDRSVNDPPKDNPPKDGPLCSTKPPRETIPGPRPDLPEDRDCPRPVPPIPGGGGSDTPVVPEPGSLLLLTIGSGIAGTSWYRRRKAAAAAQNTQD